jgi:dihydrofolate synthase / folylpolyglutamate synthase
MYHNKFTNLDQCLQWMEAQHPKEIELGLERVNTVKERLNIRFDCPVITVAGTNGKGTAVRALEIIAQSNNLSVGSLTSPHIFHFNERIKIDLAPVDDQKIVSAAARIQPFTEEVPLTYFEICVLIALIILSEANLDLVILEVGLGGRLDAVNIVDADISVITHIGLDHVDFLGDDLDTIGFEKAGILRKNQNTVLGRNLPKSVVSQANLIGCNIAILGQDFDIDEQLLYSSKLYNMSFDNLKLHPDSVALALVAYSHISVNIDKYLTKQNLEQAGLEGRWQHVSEAPKVIADVSHNPDAFQVMQLRIDKDCLNKEIVCIIGMCADKDIKGSLKHIIPKIDKWFVCDLKIDRAILAIDLKSILLDLGVNKNAVQCFESPKKALNMSKQLYQHDNQDTVLLITGSFHTVSEAFT